MTLLAVPELNWLTVSTAGSNASTVLVIIDWRARTTSHATGTGSVDQCGLDAWPPRPVTVISNSSAAASAAPARHATRPLGRFGATWIANAASTPSSTPSEIISAAPPSPSSPGWNMNRTRPGSSARRADSNRAAPTSIAVCASWPHECIVSPVRLAKSSPVSSVIGSASMSPRSTIVGPGRPPSRSATTELRRSPTAMSRPSPSSASRTAAWVRGRSSPSSGWRCSSRRSSTTSGSSVDAAPNRS